jgi:hypothetical protein
MGDVRVSADWEVWDWGADFMAVFRARRSESKERIEESNSVCAS